MRQDRTGGPATAGPWAALVTGLALAVLPVRTPLRAQDVPFPKATEPAETRPERDLITRYRLNERYATTGEFEQDAMIAQYRVGVSNREWMGPPEPAAPVPATAPTPRTRPVSNTQPAPEFKGPPQLVREVVYTDRVADVSGLGQVKSVVRRYERVRLGVGDKAQAPAAMPSEGLTIWYQPKPEDLPMVLSLTEGRPLTEGDYRLAAVERLVPTLAHILPPSPVRIGDTWPISKQAGRMLAEADQVREMSLVGKLAEVRAEVSGPGRVAVIDVSGWVDFVRGSVQARVGLRAVARFFFAVKPPEGGSPDALIPPPEREDRSGGVVDARGGLVRLSMAMQGTSRSAIDPKAGARAIKRELILARELTGAGELLEAPREAPPPTPENSWLTHVDPRRRFSFRHPQELHAPRDYGINMPESPDKLELVHRLPMGGYDRVVLELTPKGLRDPEEVHKDLLAGWKAHKFDVLPGAAEWLPEESWPPGMKVYRIEAALRLGGGIRTTRNVQRIHADGYVVHFSGPQASLFVDATTPQDPPLRFRDEVEAMIKTFRWGPPEDRR